MLIDLVKVLDTQDKTATFALQNFRCHPLAHEGYARSSYSPARLEAASPSWDGLFPDRAVADLSDRPQKIDSPSQPHHICRVLE